jgi:hypothetical protein
LIGWDAPDSVNLTMRRWFALLVLSCACAPYEKQIAFSNVRLDASRPSRFETTTKRGDVEVLFELTPDVLDVRVTTPISCRKVLVRPLRADTTTEKTLTPVGRGTQYGLAGSAVLLGILGAGLMSKPCPSSAPGPGVESGQACDAREHAVQRDLGAGVLALGVAAAGMFFVNAVRLQRERDSDAIINDFRSEGAFQKCRELPMPNQPLTLELADGRRVAAVTGRDGHARIALGALEPSTAVAVRPFAVLTGSDVRATVVDLSGTVLHQASTDKKYAVETCQKRCDSALFDCHRALRRQNAAPESAGWICHNSERECRQGCAGNKATADQAGFVLQELTEIMDGLSGLRPPLDARQSLTIASLLGRAQALRPYAQGIAVLLDEAQKRRAAKLLNRLHASLPRIAGMLKQWARDNQQEPLLTALEVFRIGL